METIKSCTNCKNYSTNKHGFWEPVCIDCSSESTADNPYPLFESIWVYEGKPSDWENDSKDDVVNHPKHYTDHPSGVECIQITEHMNFCLGNAIKYIWRAGLKSDSPIEDLKKARWYVDRELQKLEKL